MIANILSNVNSSSNRLFRVSAPKGWTKSSRSHHLHNQLKSVEKGQIRGITLIMMWVGRGALIPSLSLAPSRSLSLSRPGSPREKEGVGGVIRFRADNTLLKWEQWYGRRLFRITVSPLALHRHIYCHILTQLVNCSGLFQCISYSGSSGKVRCYILEWAVSLRL